MSRRILALIGARANPKMEDWRLGDYPLVLWPYVSALNSKYINQTYISSNSERLYSYIKPNIVTQHFIKRPDIYATATATDLEWITHALEWIEKEYGVYDIIVHLRATTPLIDPKIIDEAISIFLQSPDATSLRSAHALNESPYKMFVKDNDYWKPFMTGEGEFFNQPRQKFTTVYHPNGYVDILRPEVIKSGQLHGNKILAFETPRVIEIDSKQDLDDLQKFYKESKTFGLMKQMYV